MTKRPIRALLIEDNAGDIALTQHSFANEPFVWDVARDGETGLQRVRDTLPDIVFLDINMPRMRGDEVLAAIKNNPLTQSIPVVILTHSSNPDHVQRCYDLQAAAFCSKPVTLDKFRELAKATTAWWVDSVRLP